MKKTRTTPQALNDGLDIIGVHRIVFALFLGLSFFIAQKFSWIGGAYTGVVLIALSKLLGRKEPDWYKILPVCLRFQMARAYDPIEREYFQLEITEDGNEEEDY
jgi:hypothetical protein